jgi:hypothetical protein
MQSIPLIGGWKIAKTPALFLFVLVPALTPVNVFSSRREVNMLSAILLF